MKPFLTKVTSVLAGTGILIVGCIAAWLGLTVMAFLALFALAVLGLSIIASPFVAASNEDATTDQTETVQPNASVA